MINESTQPNIQYMLSETSQIAYDKSKALMQKVLSRTRTKKEMENNKGEFHDAYIDFARKLDDDGFEEESYDYMDLCAMYYDLIDRPDALVSHEGFFNDLFKAFDELLYVKMNYPEEYGSKYNDFLIYSGRMQQYYYTQVAIPSEYYDEEVLSEIARILLGDK